MIDKLIEALDSLNLKGDERDVVMFVAGGAVSGQSMLRSIIPDVEKFTVSDVEKSLHEGLNSLDMSEVIARRIAPLLLINQESIHQPIDPNANGKFDQAPDKSVAIESERTYRRGFCYGFNYALDVVQNLTQSGKSIHDALRSSDDFLNDTLIRWRQNVIDDVESGNLYKVFSHPHFGETILPHEDDDENG